MTEFYTPSYDKSERKETSQLSDADFKKLTDLTKLGSPSEMIKRIDSDPSFEELIKTHFKSWNEGVLKWKNISMKALQSVMLSENKNLDLGAYGADGYFGKYTFVAIIQMQKVLGLKPTGVANSNLLKNLFPRSFVRENRVEGRNVWDVKRFVDDRIDDYYGKLEKQKIYTKNKSINNRNIIVNEVLDNNINILSEAQFKSLLLSIFMQGGDKIEKKENRAESVFTKKDKPLEKGFLRVDNIEYQKRRGIKELLNLAKHASVNNIKFGAIHCTDWIDKLYIKTTGVSVYDSKTLFNGVKRINTGTGLGVEKYASKNQIDSIKPGDHIIVDKKRNGKFGRGKTHSVLALGKPVNGIVKVVSLPTPFGKPRIEKYDLYARGRAKSGLPIRIQRAV